jgi:hypothetical protein
MDKYTKLTIWSEKIITWIFGPAVVGLIGLYWAGLESLMVIPLALGAFGCAALFVIYIWRFFVKW